MNLRHKHILFAFFAAVALFAAQGARLWLKSRKPLNLEISENIGMGASLMARVDSLEREISRRISYEVTLRRDPLRLATVMRVKAPANGAETMERKDRMRLSATITSSGRNRAIIKFKGVSHMVSEGDSLFGRFIRRIDQKTVSYIEDGSEHMLVNRPAPPEEVRRPSPQAIADIEL